MPVTDLPKKSDRGCFVARADAKPTPLELVPPCHFCGDPSRGGTFIEFDASLFGRAIGVVRFSCGCDGATGFGVMSEHLAPSWKILASIAPGLYRLRKLTEAEQEAAARDARH